MVTLSAKEQELSERIAGTKDPIRIEGSNAHSGFRLGSSGEVFSMRGHAGIVEHNPSDMVATVRAGTTLGELESELKVKGQCVPVSPLEGFPFGTIGGAIAMALPHPSQARWGTWRDWVLGLKLLLADGTIVKCGSRAVKNVAGYDIQKLIVGSRGSLAVILEASIRTFPLTALDGALEGVERGTQRALCSIQRTLRTDFDAALQASEETMLYACRESATLWLAGQPEKRFPQDWVITSGAGDANVEIRDANLLRLMLRTKEIFDPAHKLNPGEWGFM